MVASVYMMLSTDGIDEDGCGYFYLFACQTINKIESYLASVDVIYAFINKTVDSGSSLIISNNSMGITGKGKDSSVLLLGDKYSVSIYIGAFNIEKGKLFIHNITIFINSSTVASIIYMSDEGIVKMDDFRMNSSSSYCPHYSIIRILKGSLNISNGEIDNINLSSCSFFAFGNGNNNNITLILKILPFLI